MRSLHPGRAACALILLLVGCSDAAVNANNAAPTATIELPAPGFVATPGDPVTLRGVVADRTTPASELSVLWLSSEEGELFAGTADAEGVTEMSVADLSLGGHTITLQVRDSEGASAQDSVVIEILAPEPVNTAPSAPVVAITPAEPSPFEALTCSIVTPSTDVDLDEVTYAFAMTRDGELIGEYDEGTANDEMVVTATATDVGQEFVCTVTPNDGQVDGPSGSDTVTIGCPAGSGLSPECAGLTCLSIRQGGQTVSGVYWITAGTPDTTLVRCDMDTDGGGWTAIVWVQAEPWLGATVTAIEAAPTEGTDPLTGPFTADTNGGHAYFADVPFPAGYTQFRIDADYRIASNACVGPNCTCGDGICTADIDGSCFAQTDWAQGYAPPGCGSYGDVAFGSPALPGPTTSYGAQMGTLQSLEPLEELAWPAPDTLYSGAPGGDIALRVAWGEVGGEDEGWFPWYAGTIWLR